MKGKVKAMAKVNLVQSRKFGDMLQDSLDAYNQRGVTTELVIRKLIELAKTMQAEETDGDRLGLSVEEKAFYDALADEHRAAEELGTDKLQEIAKALVKEVRESAQRTDWVQRESARASMRIAVKQLLRKYGYPPDFTQSAVDTVVEQAEKMAFNENDAPRS